MPNKPNYQRALDEIIHTLEQKTASNSSGQDEAKTRAKAPRLLLHSCCAPCSSYVLEYLSDYFVIKDFLYNTNIAPQEEYRYREEELKRLIREMHPKYEIAFVAGKYDPERFYETVRGLEHIREGGERCFACYRLRMEEAALLAAKGGYDYFTTTLTISPLKNAEKINEIGRELEVQYGVKHLPSDFKKRGGYLRSIELSKEHGLYRQDYCGCVFSKAEREREKRTRAQMESD